jgi:hypothetical protein
MIYPLIMWPDGWLLATTTGWESCSLWSFGEALLRGVSKDKENNRIVP